MKDWPCYKLNVPALELVDNEGAAELEPAAMKPFVDEQFWQNRINGKAVRISPNQRLKFEKLFGLFLDILMTRRNNPIFPSWRSEHQTIYAEVSSKDVSR